VIEQWREFARLATQHIQAARVVAMATETPGLPNRETDPRWKWEQFFPPAQRQTVGN
jgi:hypothetical protein